MMSLKQGIWTQGHASIVKEEMVVFRIMTVVFIV